MVKTCLKEIAMIILFVAFLHFYVVVTLCTITGRVDSFVNFYATTTPYALLLVVLGSCIIAYDRISDIRCEAKYSNLIREQDDLSQTDKSRTKDV